MTGRTKTRRQRWSMTWVMLAALAHAATAPAQTTPSYPAQNYPTQNYVTQYAPVQTGAARTGAIRQAAAVQPAPASQPWPRGERADVVRFQQSVPAAAPSSSDRGVNPATASPSPANPNGLAPANGLLPTPDQLRLPEPAQPGAVPGGITLQQAEQMTILYNPIMRRALARIDSARGGAQQAALYPNPRWDTNNPWVFAGSGSSVNAGFIQEMPVKGKLRLDKAAANEVVRQKEYGLTQDRFALLMAVRQQFYTVLSAQRRVAVLTDLRGIAAAAVRAAEGRVRATEGTYPEVLLAQTELQRAEISLRNAQTNVDAGRRQLAAIIGRPDLSIEQVAGELAFGFPDFDAEGLRQFVVTQNAQVQIARLDIDRNQILLRRARVEPFPNPTIGPATQIPLTQSPGAQQLWLNIYFDIPVWNRNQGNIQAAQANINDAVASLGILQNDLLRQVEDALGRYIAARQSEERIRTQILPTARRAQQLVKNGYQEGLLDISTLLQAQRSLSEASLSYIDSLQDVWLSAAEIAQLLQLERFP
jgi:outer membrane protein, heavy metal efflux system